MDGLYNPVFGWYTFIILEIITIFLEWSGGLLYFYICNEKERPSLKRLFYLIFFINIYSATFGLIVWRVLGLA